MRRTISRWVLLPWLAVVACGRQGASSAVDGGVEPTTDDAASAVDGASPIFDAQTSIPPPIDDADTNPSVDAGNDDPGGPWVVFASTSAGTFDLYLVHPDGTGQRVLVQTPGSDLHPSWSPASTGARTVAFASDQSGQFQIYLVDVARGVVTRVPTGLAYATNPSFSPEGAELAFSGDTDAGGAIFRVPLDGGAAVALTTGAGHRDSAPAWASDGTIYFATDRSGAFEVWSVAPDGGALAQVTTGSQIIAGPATTPDAGALLFAQLGSGPAGSGSNTQVVLLSLADKSTSVFSSFGDFSPAMSSDGARIAMTTTRYAGVSAQIVLVNADGGAPFRLTNDGGVNDEAVFEPAR